MKVPEGGGVGLPGAAGALADTLAPLGERACVIVEPVQGEGGVRIPPPGYLAEVGRLCTAHGAFLGVDTSFHKARWRDIRDRIFGRIDPISTSGREWRSGGLENVTLIEGHARFLDARTIDTGTGETITPVDALKRKGGAAEWVSSSADACEPYAVDIEVQHEPSCASAGVEDEVTLFPDFRWDSLEFDLREATISATGRCNCHTAGRPAECRPW